VDKILSLKLEGRFKTHATDGIRMI